MRTDAKKSVEIAIRTEAASENIGCMKTSAPKVPNTGLRKSKSQSSAKIESASETQLRLSKLSRKIARRHRDILEHAQQWIDAVRECGTWLLEVKHLVGHGKFGRWISDNLSFSHRTANDYMRVASEYSKLDKPKWTPGGRNQHPLGSIQRVIEALRTKEAQTPRESAIADIVEQIRLLTDGTWEDDELEHFSEALPALLERYRTQVVAPMTQLLRDQTCDSREHKFTAWQEHFMKQLSPGKEDRARFPAGTFDVEDEATPPAEVTGNHSERSGYLFENPFTRTPASSVAN